MTSLADSVAWLRQPRWIEGSFQKKLFDIADLLASQAKALSEHEVAYDGLMKAKETFRAEAHRNAARALAAEARLAEAMRVIEPFANATVVYAGQAIGLERQWFAAARAFTNAAKEKT